MLYKDIAPLLNDNSGGDVLQDNAEPLGSNSMPVRKQLQHTFQQWPLYWDRPVDYQEACEILTTMRVVPNKKICSTVPQNFRGEGTFVIDLRPLNNRHDAGLDGLGTWGRPTGRNRYYTQDKDGNLIRADDGRGNLLPNTEYVWKCMLKRYEHPATAQFKGGENRFIKKIYTALYPPERREAVALAVVTYEWIGKAFNFRVLPLAQKVRRNNIAVPPDGSKDWEGASFNNADLTSLPATCSACFGDSPLYAVGAIDFNTAACIILGGLIVDAAKYYKIDPNTGDAVRIDRGNKLIDGAEYDIQILSKRYEHPSVGGRFVRKIYTGRSPSGDRFYHTCSHLAVITYYWKGEPEWFEAGPQRRVHHINFSILSDFTRMLLNQMNTILGQSSRAPDLGMPAIKRPRKLLPRINTSDLNDRDLESVKAMIYKKEYENQERLAGILDRAESFLDRLDRVSMFFQHMPDPEQQIWMSNDPGSTVGHQEEVIMDGGATEHTVYPDGEYVME
uniref:Protein kinase domain-containing protein n=1 Tax=Heterorhabditis bacteriophora TaxID=37862 RepID=A0A1I7XK57_HETBA